MALLAVLEVFLFPAALLLALILAWKPHNREKAKGIFASSPIGYLVVVFVGFVVAQS